MKLNSLEIAGINEKVNALKLAVNSTWVVDMARIHELLRGLRVWRVCNDMILELERDYTILEISM